eukprot:12803665-Alexandrium_andersonii.AAC.1
MSAKSQQFRVSRNAGHLLPRRPGGRPTPLHRRFRALSGPPPNGHRSMGESALPGQLWAPLRGAPSCCVKASSPIARRPLGGGPKRALNGLWRRVGLRLGRLGHRKVAHCTTTPNY